MTERNKLGLYGLVVCVLSLIVLLSYPIWGIIGYIYGMYKLSVAMCMKKDK